MQALHKHELYGEWHKHELYGEWLCVCVWHKHKRASTPLTRSQAARRISNTAAVLLHCSRVQPCMRGSGHRARGRRHVHARVGHCTPTHHSSVERTGPPVHAHDGRKGGRERRVGESREGSGREGVRTRNGVLASGRSARPGRSRTAGWKASQEVEVHRHGCSGRHLPSARCIINSTPHR
jgi:hypothetical protein